MGGHVDDQKAINSGIKSLADCNQNFKEDSNAAATVKQNLDTTQGKHATCRRNQTVLKSKKDEDYEELDTFRKTTKKELDAMSTNKPKVPTDGDAWWRQG